MKESEWDKPIPLTGGLVINEEFSLETLPSPLAEMAECICRTMNVSSSMAGSLMLSVISIAMRKKYRVFIKDDLNMETYI